MFGWLAGAESDQDTQEPRKVTRSGKLTEKSREEAIKRPETEKLANESNKRYRKYVKSLETDQNPAQVPPGGDTPPTDEELGEQQEQDLPRTLTFNKQGVVLEETVLETVLEVLVIITTLQQVTTHKAT